jgi:hypothetical protein
LKFFPAESQIYFFQDLQFVLNESGFEICSAAFVSVSAVDVAVQVLVTTQYQNMRKLDPSLHCKFIC